MRNQTIKNLTGSDELNDKDKAYQQDEQDKRNSRARKRIDELLEQKRLRSLLDDSEDWDV